MKKPLTTAKLLALQTVLIIFITPVVNATTYYSSGNQPPNLVARWWVATNGTGAHPTVFTNAADIFIVQTGNTYTMTGAWAVSGSVQVQTGATLTTGATNTWTISIGGTTSVTGTLTLTNTSIKTFTGAVTVNNGGVFTISGNQTVNVAGNLTVANGGTLNHNNSYDNASIYLQVNGDLSINGTYAYGVNLPAIWMNGIGTKNINTGTTALCKLLLRQANFYANGTVTINQDFYAMWNQVGGSFHTNGQTVTANWGLVNNGGILYVDGGSLTVGSTVGGMLIGRTLSQNGDVQVSAGTLNTAGIYLGTTTTTPKGTFTQSGGIINTNILDIGNSSSFVQSGGTNNINGTLNLNYSTSTYSHTSGPTTVNIAGSLNNSGVYSTGAGTASINIEGNWTNNLTFTTSATNTVTFNGTGNQVLGGTAATSFNNLVINPSAGFSVSAAIASSIVSNLDVMTGTFDLGTYACNRTTGGGTLTLASAATLKLAGGSGGAGSSNFPNNFTTYSLHANSTVEYNGTGAQTVYATNYGYLTLSTGGTKTAGGIATIAGDLNINTTAIFAGGTFAHSIAGNWYNNVSATAYIPGTSTVTFNGTAAQTIGGTSGNTFNNLIIDNVNGVKILQDQSANSTLTLTTGRLNIGTSNLTLGAAASTISGAPFSATKMIITDGGGEVRKNFSGTGSFVFPIGDSTGTVEYSPITLNVSSGTFAGGAYAGVKLTNAKHASNASTTDYLNRYWTVSNSGITSPSFNATATYLSADIAGTEANIAAAKYVSALPWTKYSIIGSFTLTATAVSNTGTNIFITGITNAVPAVSITGGGVSICTPGSVSLGSTVSNNGTSTASYLWSPAATLSSSTIYNPTATPSGTTIYSLIVTDGNGITSTAATTTIAVTISPSATISYPASPFCYNVGSASVTFSGTPGGSYSASPTGATINSAGLVDLATSSPGRYTVTYDIAASGGCPTYTTNTIIVINPNTWTGTISSDWGTAGNWAGNAALSPSCADVTILSGTLYPPMLNSGTAAIQNLIIQPGASLTISNSILKVSGTITNNGSLDVKNGTLDLNGSSVQTISGNLFVDSTVMNLTVSNTTGVNISGTPAKPLSVTGALSFGNVNSSTLSTGDNIVLVSTATGTARVADITNNAVNSGNSFNGKVFLERYFPARRAWRLVTAPLSGTGTIFSTWQNSGVFTAGRGISVTGPGANPATNGLDVSIQNKPSLKMGTTITPVTNTLITYLSSNTGNADNKGYFLFVRGDRTTDNFNISNKNITTVSSSGKLQTGDQDFTASPTAGAFTLIGNPYASPVDFSTLARTNLRPRFYAWDPYINAEQGGYVVLELDAISGTYVPTPPSPGGQTNIIQSSQAFFVETTNNGTAAIKFTEHSKSSTNNLAIFRPVIQLAASFRSNLYLLEDDGNRVLADGNLVRFDSSFNPKADAEDALKFGNVYENFSVLTNGISLAIARRPHLKAHDTIFFKFLGARAKKYQFEFVPTNLNPNLLPMLQDGYTGKLTPLSKSNTSTVNFEVDSKVESQSPSRFRIIFSKVLDLPITRGNIKSYKQGENVMVEWKVKNELNVNSYDVEKSTDGRNFTKVNTTAAKAGDGGSITYNWLDVKADQGTNFYRIKNHAYNGTVNFSEVAKIVIMNAAKSISVYPNPVTDGLIGLQLTNLPAGQYHARMINDLGQVILSKNIKHPGGTSLKKINTGKNMREGIYQLEITKPDNSKAILNISVQ